MDAEVSIVNLPSAGNQWSRTATVMTLAPDRHVRRVSILSIRREGRCVVLNHGYRLLGVFFYRHQETIAQRVAFLERRRVEFLVPRSSTFGN